MGEQPPHAGVDARRSRDDPVLVMDLYAEEPRVPGQLILRRPSQDIKPSPGYLSIRPGQIRQKLA